MRGTEEMKTAIFLKLAMAAAVVPAMLMVSGCSQGPQLDELEAQLDEIRAQPRGRIEPPPEFEPIATFSYGAHQQRPPFTPPVEEEERETPDGREVEPDMDRSREYLERFALDSLRMVGTITREGEPVQALILDPTGSVNRVRAGDYMGRNFGQVIEISETRISLVEIVPDGRDGWVERSRSIRLAE